MKGDRPAGCSLYPGRPPSAEFGRCLAGEPFGAAGLLPSAPPVHPSSASCTAAVARLNVRKERLARPLCLIDTTDPAKFKELLLWGVFQGAVRPYVENDYGLRQLNVLARVLRIVTGVWVGKFASIDF